MFHTSHDELAEIADSLDYHAEDLAEISALQTRKGEHSTCFVDCEAHGRATVRIYLSDIEYWACSADPERDQPLRAAGPAADRRGRVGRDAAARGPRLAPRPDRTAHPTGPGGDARVSAFTLAGRALAAARAAGSSSSSDI